MMSNALDCNTYFFHYYFHYVYNMDFKCKLVTSASAWSNHEFLPRLEEKFTVLELWKKNILVSNLKSFLRDFHSNLYPSIYIVLYFCCCLKYSFLIFLSSISIHADLSTLVYFKGYPVCIPFLVNGHFNLFFFSLVFENLFLVFYLLFTNSAFTNDT